MTPHVRLIDIEKAYGPAKVLKGVSFDVLPGEVHVLAGENGAGKSTLIKVLGGVVTDYSGTVAIAGEAVRLRSPIDAAQRGVAVIHQELSLVPSMSVVDNLFLGEAPTKNGFVQQRQMEAAAKSALGKVGLDLPLDTPVERLPIATQQLVEVAKALRRESRVVVMDEPTSALNIQEAERLFSLVADLKSQGVGIVYISHKMDEIERLADRITVLRDGEWVATEPAALMPVSLLIRHMVGTSDSPSSLAQPIQAEEAGTRHANEEGAGGWRSGEPPLPPGGEGAGGEGLADIRPPHTPSAQRRTPPLEVRNLSLTHNARKVVDDVSLQVLPGEVVGLAGLEGSGNSALLLAIFGALGRPTGEILLDGSPTKIKSPQDAIRKRIALLTSDRKTSGLVLPLSITANATLASLPALTRKGWRSETREREVAERAKQNLGIRAATLDMPVSSLSGGNQQKVALAKWLATHPKVLLLDEPTRGIDINAKREIYALIERLKAEGMAIVIITSELPELLLLADRILVMHRGHIVTEMSRSEATPDKVVQAAMNA